MPLPYLAVVALAAHTSHTRDRLGRCPAFLDGERAVDSVVVESMQKWAKAVANESQNPVAGPAMRAMRGSAKVRSGWAARAIPQEYRKLPVLYVFSGLDMTTALGLFPESDEYLFLAEFPAVAAGHEALLTNPRSYQDASKHKELADIAQQYLDHQKGSTAFGGATISATMRTAFSPRGTLPALLATLAIFGYEIVGASTLPHSDLDATAVRAVHAAAHSARVKFQLKRGNHQYASLPESAAFFQGGLQTAEEMAPENPSLDNAVLVYARRPNSGACVRIMYVGVLVKAFRDLQRVARRFELGHHHSWSLLFKGGPWWVNYADNFTMSYLAKYGSAIVQDDTGVALTALRDWGWHVRIYGGSRVNYRQPSTMVDMIKDEGNGGDLRDQEREEVRRLIREGAVVGPHGIGTWTYRKIADSLHQMGSGADFLYLATRHAPSPPPPPPPPPLPSSLPPPPPPSPPPPPFMHAFGVLHLLIAVSGGLAVGLVVGLVVVHRPG